MKCPGPSQCVRYRLGARFQNLHRNALDAPSEFGRGATGERQEENATRIDAADDKMRDPMRESFGLARAGASDNEKWRPLVTEGADAVLYNLALLAVEFAKISGSACHVESPHSPNPRWFLFCSRSSTGQRIVA